MNLWGVTMVKDELDILPYTIENLVGQGVERLIVADNMSTDGTWEWLQEYQAANEGLVLLKRDEEVGYYQSRKMTALADMAFSLGAEWILPFDADEFWYCASPGPFVPISRALAVVAHSVQALKARLYNYFPTSKDPADELNPFRRITYRDTQPAPLPKVLVRPGLRILQGNHGVAGVEPVPCNLRVAHFPWRSPEQFERKVRNGSEAYAATELPPDVGAHWRQWGQILAASGPGAIRDIYHEWFHDPEMELARHPVPVRPAAVGSP